MFCQRRYFPTPILVHNDENITLNLDNYFIGEYLQFSMKASEEQLKVLGGSVEVRGQKYQKIFERRFSTLNYDITFANSVLMQRENGKVYLFIVHKNFWFYVYDFTYYFLRDDFSGIPQIHLSSEHVMPFAKQLLSYCADLNQVNSTMLAFKCLKKTNQDMISRLLYFVVDVSNKMRPQITRYTTGWETHYVQALIAIPLQSMHILLLNKTDNQLTLHTLNQKKNELELCEGCLVMKGRLINETFSDCLKVIIN